MVRSRRGLQALKTLLLVSLILGVLAIVTGAESAPPVPESLRVLSKSDTALTIGWNEAQEGSGQRYIVSVNGEAAEEVYAQTVELTGLQPDTAYTVSVAAADATGATSEAASLSAQTTPTTYFAVGAALSESGTQITITGSAPESTAQMAGITVTDSTGTLSYVDEVPLENGAFSITRSFPQPNRQYRVRAVLFEDEVGVYKTVLVGEESYGSSVTLNCTANQEFDYLVTAHQKGHPAGSLYRVTYPADALEVVDLCRKTPEADLAVGPIAQTNIEIVSFDPTSGTIEFRITDQADSEGMLWSGLLNEMRFRALQDGDTTITLEASAAMGGENE